MNKTSTESINSSTNPEGAVEPVQATNFIRAIIDEDLKNNKNAGKVITRFPPEPNGYLHIGHAKSICINFGTAADYNGVCHLRYDDTNPSKEDIEYEESIARDVKWLGFEWGKNIFYASDYYEKIYEYAIQLIKAGKAYVCGLNADQIREYRGTLTQAGKDSPDRHRSVEENLELFEKMKNGEFEEGQYILRAKIDMSSPNINMRDPAIYRIRKLTHNRTGNKWCIYPMYDFAHCISDMIEGITHSICTLEFEDHRPLYDWFLDELKTPCHPQQIEFARLNINYTVMSKRKLLQLVEEGLVNGWDDPRMPTLAGMRRRGYTPAAIRNFCEGIGVAKANSTVDIALLYYYLRDDLNKTANRVMAVIDPVKVIIDNYPDGQVEELDAENNPEDTNGGTRKIPFSKVLYIEKEDFREDPPKKYFRLFPGGEVRLKHAYYITCNSIVKDEQTGEIKEVHCTYDPATRGGWSDDGRRVKGTLHWVCAKHAVPAEVRLYDHLFTEENPDAQKDFKECINPDSLQVVNICLIEPGLAEAKPGDRFQFLRQGYFSADLDTTTEKPVFNRIVGMRDSWAKIESKQIGNSK
ncbi:MAG: glutamine--tRNA ligase/YqeY domain fusion protein [Candidatus Margulisiibacteriota bacterium]